MSITGECPFCFNKNETINHIFKNCDFTVNIRNTIENNGLNLLNYAFGTIDQLEYIWLNKSQFRKRFHNAIEKTITIIWAICIHRNNIIFNGTKSNPSVIFELAKGFFMKRLFMVSALFLTFHMQVKIYYVMDISSGRVAQI